MMGLWRFKMLASAMFVVIGMASVLMLSGCGDKKSKGGQAAEAADTPVTAVTDTAAATSLDKTVTATIETDSTLVDGRDGKTYKKVKIGNQTWMAENLNYNISGSKCYGDGGRVVSFRDSEGYPIEEEVTDETIREYCANYGRLYDWAAAMKACPAGWHLPSDDEWTALTDSVGSSAGKKLKSKTGWSGDGNGTDNYGFSALPGGLGGFFSDAGFEGNWWSATEEDDSEAYRRTIKHDGKNVDRRGMSKPYLFSVRCVKDK